MVQDNSKATSAVGLRVLLVDDRLERSAMLGQALEASGHQVLARLDASAELLSEVERLQPDVVLIELEAPGRDTLESLAIMHRDHPRPVVLLAQHSDAEMARSAIRAGVSAYVVDTVQPDRVRSIIDVAIARFNEFQTLRRELDSARTQLAERKLIEKAKGLLMQRRGLDEESAYRMLRKLAMDRNQRMADLARNLLDLAGLFEGP